MRIVEHAPSTSHNHSNIQALDSLHTEIASNKKLFPDVDIPSQFESKKDVLERIPPLMDAAEVTKCEWFCVMTLNKPQKDKEKANSKSGPAKRLKEFTASLAAKLRQPWENLVTPALRDKIKAVCENRELEAAPSGNASKRKAERGEEDDEKAKKAKKEKVEKEPKGRKQKVKDEKKDKKHKKDKKDKKDKRHQSGADSDEFPEELMMGPA